MDLSWSLCSGLVLHLQCSSTTAHCPYALPAGGTRFIGLYLARMLIEQGHDVTLYTRGKKKIAYQIPDDTATRFRHFELNVKHIAGDRKVHCDTCSCEISIAALLSCCNHRD